MKMAGTKGSPKYNDERYPFLKLLSGEAVRFSPCDSYYFKE
jgi:hypothetical protein